MIEKNLIWKYRDIYAAWLFWKLCSAFWGVIFYMSNIVCQSVFLNRAFLSVENAILDAMVFSRFKWIVNRTPEKLWWITSDSHCRSFLWMTIGVSVQIIFRNSVTSVRQSFLCSTPLSYFIKSSLIHMGEYIFDETRDSIYLHNRNMKSGILPILLLSLCYTRLVL